MLIISYQVASPANIHTSYEQALFRIVYVYAYTYTHVTAVNAEKKKKTVARNLKGTKEGGYGRTWREQWEGWKHYNLRRGIWMDVEKRPSRGMMLLYYISKTSEVKIILSNKKENLLPDSLFLVFLFVHSLAILSDI